MGPAAPYELAPSCYRCEDRRRVIAFRIAQWALVAARVFMGAFFLYESTGQIAKGWIGGDGLRNMLASALRDHSMPPPYRYFLEHVVLKHDQLFTAIVIPGEIAVGSALILGVATRFTAIMALFMNLNFFIMNGAVTPGALFDALFIVVECVLIAGAERQALSIDGALAQRGMSSWWLSGAPQP
ncbi:MAG: DoxX family membrane protein [Chloroflexota bacterium]|nr:DoxX family membrane protein [Chloroflexota bacterium]